VTINTDDPALTNLDLGSWCETGGREAARLMLLVSRAWRFLRGACCLTPRGSAVGQVAGLWCGFMSVWPAIR
jgi:hypothetical protein